MKVIQKKTVLWTLPLLMILSPSESFAKGSQMGVSTGVVWQADSDTTRLNSANTRMVMDNINLAGGFGEASGSAGSYEAALSYVGSSQALGYGLGVTYIPSEGSAGNGMQAIGAMGVGGRHFGIGVGLQYEIAGSVQSGEDLGLDLGLHIGGMDGFGFGANVANLTGDILITLGMGYRSPGTFSFELDGRYDMDDSEIDQITLAFAFELSRGVLSLMAGYQANPDDLGGGEVLAGMHVWASRRLGMKVTYQNSVWTPFHDIGVAFDIAI